MLKIIFRESFLCKDEFYRTVVTGFIPYGQTKAIRISAVIEQLDSIFLFHFFHGPIDPIDVLALKRWDIANSSFINKEILENTTSTSHNIEDLYDSMSEYSSLSLFYLHINTVDKILEHEFRGTKEELERLYKEEDVHPENLIVIKTK